MADHAPFDTRLGQLQRGSGRGFLAALQQPAAARGELRRCILVDPRLEPQSESRCRYFAELALQLELPIGELVEHAGSGDDPYLAIDVLAELAARGQPAARALLQDSAAPPPLVAGMVGYLRDFPDFAHGLLPLPAVAQLAGQLQQRDELVDDVEIYGVFWQPYARPLAAVADAFALAAARAAVLEVEQPAAVDDPALLSTAALLDQLDVQPSAAVQQELERRTGSDDRALLAHRVEHDQATPRLWAAASALGGMGDVRLLELAEAWFSRPDDFTDPARMLSPIDRQRRIALLRYFTALPAPLTLPLARRWWRRGGYLQTAAAAVLRQHAEPADRGWLEPACGEALRQDAAAMLQDELAALQQIGDPASLPLYLQVAERSSSAWVRTRALAGIAAYPGTPAAQMALGEALWDCEPEARAFGCRHALPSAAAQARLTALAADPLEEPDTRAAAAARLLAPPG